jgi:hypothetical protein
MVGKLPYFRPTKRVFVKMKRSFFLWNNKCTVIEPHSHVLFVGIGSTPFFLVSWIRADTTCHTEIRDRYVRKMYIPSVMAGGGG